VTFEVRAGESVGMIGPNGAGKSTLLQILGGSLTPTSGTIRRRGRVASMIELGLGLHPELTGAENAVFAATLLGLTPRQARAQLPAITEFSGLGDDLDRPVKHYSSGMMARLGFAIASRVEPDILLIDEVLAVGDAAFRRASLELIEEMVAGGTTLVFVSHNATLVEQVCTRCVHLEAGRVVADGPTAIVLERYLTAARLATGHHDATAPVGAALDGVRIDPAVIEPGEALTVTGSVRRRHGSGPLGLVATLRTDAETFRDEEDPDRASLARYWNVVIDDALPPGDELVGDGPWTFRFRLEGIPLTPGLLELTVAVTAAANGTILDERALLIDIAGSRAETPQRLHARLVHDVERLEA